MKEEQIFGICSFYVEGKRDILCHPPSLNHTMVNRSGGVWGNGSHLTNEWMRKDFNRPIQMMERLKSTFNDTLDAEMIYHHLLKHGMYSPNQKTKLTWEDLQENDVWEKHKACLQLIKSYGRA